MYSCLKRRPIAALEEAIVTTGKKKETVEKKGNLTRRTANSELEMLHKIFSAHIYIHTLYQPAVGCAAWCPGCPGRHRIGAAAHAATYTQRLILFVCMYVCMWAL